MADVAAQNETPIVAITDSNLSPLAKAASVLFTIPEDEYPFSRSLAAPMCLAQSIAVSLAAHPQEEVKGVPRIPTITGKLQKERLKRRKLPIRDPMRQIKQSIFTLRPHSRQRPSCARSSRSHCRSVPCAPISDFAVSIVVARTNPIRESAGSDWHKPRQCPHCLLTTKGACPECVMLARGPNPANLEGT